MPKKRFSPEQIVTLLRQIEVVMGQGKLRQVDVLMAQGRSVSDAVRSIAVTEGCCEVK